MVRSRWRERRLGRFDVMRILFGCYSRLLPSTKRGCIVSEVFGVSKIHQLGLAIERKMMRVRHDECCKSLPNVQRVSNTFYRDLILVQYCRSIESIVIFYSCEIVELVLSLVLVAGR